MSNRTITEEDDTQIRICLGRIKAIADAVGQMDGSSALSSSASLTRPETGPIKWFDPTPANTDYWEVHRQQGRAMAFELLDLINNPDRERDENGDTPNWFGYIAGAIARTETLMRQKYNTDGLGIGFFEAIGEHLMTGGYNR